MSEHTPGPWAYDAGRGGNSYPRRIRHAGLEIATVYGDTYAECEDNARLIAAAPSLLAALQEISAGNTMQGEVEYGYSDIIQKHCAIAKAAIAKAKGE